MTNTNSKKPDISGVSEEIQNTIKQDLHVSISNPSEKAYKYHSLLAGKKVGVSVSENEELEELGYSTIHLKDLMIELVRNLLINGAVIVYGGNLNKEGYTYLFSDLAFQYRDKNESKTIYFENYFAYPIYKLLTTEDEAHFKKHRTSIIKVPFKGEGVEEEKYFPPNTYEAKLQWAQSLTNMRKIMIANTDARILVGGKVGNYLGSMPGVIEEAKISLEQGKPLYLIGALGGATKQVIAALKGSEFDFMTSEFHQSEEYTNLKNQYNKQENNKIDLVRESFFFKNFGVTKLAQLNGLTVEENEKLFVTTNLPEILYYLFKGLKTIFKNKGG